jgi:MFS family permease
MWWGVALISLAQLMTAVDATIVNVSLPPAQADLHFSDDARVWVVTAYTLAYASLLLPGGRFADRYGPRRALTTGLALFAVASAAAGAAWTFPLLVSARSVQGAAAALMTPAALAMLARVVPAPAARARAFGIFGAVASSGAVIGLLAGGLLTSGWGWRWCLYINVPIAAGALLGGVIVLPRTEGHRTPMPLATAAGITAGFCALVLGASRAGVDGWAAPATWLTMLVGTALVVGCIAAGQRSDAPLVPASLLTGRASAASMVATAAAIVGTLGVFLLLTFHFQKVLGYDPTRTGLAFLPLSLAVAAAAYGLASRLMQRLPARTVIVPGLLAIGAGLAVISRVDPRAVEGLVAGEVLVGIGVGCVITPALALVTSMSDRRSTGIVSAITNVAMQLGGTLGATMLNTVALASASTTDPVGLGGATGVAALALAASATVVWILMPRDAAVGSPPPTTHAPSSDRNPDVLPS